MKRGAFGLLGLLTTMGFVVGTGAQACSPATPWMFVFDPNSSHVREKAADLFSNWAVQLQSVDPKCVAFEVRGFADSTEAKSITGELAAARTAEITRLLTKMGFLAANIRTSDGGQKLRIANEPLNRTVEMKWYWAKGKMRCDPATKQQPFGAACQGEYAACYLELEDGTVCNINNVPDPNPTKYSAVLGNK